MTNPSAQPKPRPVRRKLIDFAIRLPEASKDFPWGESAAKASSWVPQAGACELVVSLRPAQWRFELRQFPEQQPASEIRIVTLKSGQDVEVR